MSRVDENGVWHPTPEDLFSGQTQTHIAYCRECNPYALPELVSVAEAELAALIYEVHWVKGIRDASLVTDEEIAKAILEQFAVVPR